jgi:hypothetical protein
MYQLWLEESHETCGVFNPPAANTAGRLKAKNNVIEGKHSGVDKL